MIAHYEQQVAAHTARRDLEIARSVRISRLRLATVVPAVALLVIAGARTFSAAALTAALVLLLILRCVRSLRHPRTLPKGTTPTLRPNL